MSEKSPDEAWRDLCDLAHLPPDSWTILRDARAFRLRLQRFGLAITEAEIRSTYEAMASQPHVHSVSVWHDFDKPCAEGRIRHPGCCDPARCPTRRYPKMPRTKKKEATA